MTCSSSSSSSAAMRFAVLGQKDAMLRALYELAQVKRTSAIEVIVISPSNAATIPHSANVVDVCASLGYRYILGSTNEVVLEALCDFRPDLLISILWPRKVSKQMLDACRCCINFHPSLLPRHRGSLTQFWTIFEGDAEGGTTCHHMVEAFDAGRILHQVAVKVSPSETALSLSLKIAAATEQCFQHVLGEFLRSDGKLSE
ncbi:unnamed protein product, partial [Polarella glacialis]